MKSIIDYIMEELSDANKKTLQTYINRGLINDDNFNDIYNVIKRKIKSNSVDTEKYTSFFKKHGILNLNWGRKGSAISSFVNLFNETNKIQALNAIVDNDGVISINDSKFTNTGNIFDYCNIKSGKRNFDFSDEAKTIATWINSTSAAAGPCEMLLKFILKEGCDKGVGDVGIDTDSEQEEMEVKASTIGAKNASGGHPVGQRKVNGQDVRKTWAIYHYLNNNLLGLNTNNAYADKCAYFQNDKGVNDFAEKINKAKLSKDDVAKGIVDALCFQYNFITNEEGSKNSLANIDKLYDSAKKYLKFTNSFEKQNLLNLVGCIQLYLYSQAEQFNYFFCVMIDKNEESTNAKNGFYVLFRNCTEADTDLLKFDVVTEHIHFGTLDSTTSSQGRSGKIYINK